MTDNEPIRRGDAERAVHKWLSRKHILNEIAAIPALAPQPVTDALAMPEVRALVEAADHLLANYLQDQLDEPNLCVDEDHWLAIHEVRAALSALKAKGGV
jgi:hypothetical protein